jgi:NAD(P)-dependent dehydrogenase (short-subunit alcohol dehydrogenase family)
MPRVEHPLELSPDATYVLAGGLGGLGRSLSGLLVKHGAKHLAFFSRSSAVSEEQVNFLNDLKRQGIDGRPYACDICDKAALEATIKSCGKEMPAIRGVIQGAAVIRVQIRPLLLLI